MPQFHYFVYILRCADDSYYIGVTNNLDRRVQEHRDGLNPTCYTFERRPLELAYAEWYHDVPQAISREKQLKRWSRAKKEALIEGNVRRLRLEALALERRA
ncbi:MAG TPA: GIY-YIG nuclease family protein, partial [Flavobacteriales bacterium]|nr:GIY-YIG nuclease family protein [Flavobacteriales bacterium]